MRERSDTEFSSMWNGDVGLEDLCAFWGLTINNIRKWARLLNLKHRHSRGSKHWSWKGGVSHHGSGYVLLYMPDHPRSRGKYVLEHIAVVEKAIGRYLPPKACVHHIDEDPSNNRHDNLVVCEDNAYHRLLHARLRVVKRGGDPDIERICCTCDGLFPFKSVKVLTCKPCQVKRDRLRNLNRERPSLIQRHCSYSECGKSFAVTTNNVSKLYCSEDCRNMAWGRSHPHRWRTLNTGDIPSFFKLSDEQVKQIRNQYRPGIGVTALAHKYGVTRQTIRHVATGKTRSIPLSEWMDDHSVKTLNGLRDTKMNKSNVVPTVEENRSVQSGETE